MKKAILFDLDGTLLPMDNDSFTRYYFKLLSQTVAPLGYEPDKLIDAVWKGTMAMFKNDGSRTNYDAFWETFSSIFGERVLEDIEKFNDFYSTKFHEAIVATSPTKLAKQAVQAAREHGEKVILATNPLFPKMGVETRLSWIDLTTADFDYVTTYENSTFCKPNPAYYKEILEKMNLLPEDCVMIGNNVEEDYKAATSLGIETYIVKDNVIGEITGLKTTEYGTYTEMIEFLKTL